MHWCTVYILDVFRLFLWGHFFWALACSRDRQGSVQLPGLIDKISVFVFLEDVLQFLWFGVLMDPLTAKSVCSSVFRSFAVLNLEIKRREVFCLTDLPSG